MENRNLYTLETCLGIFIYQTGENAITFWIPQIQNIFTKHITIEEGILV